MPSEWEAREIMDKIEEGLEHIAPFPRETE